MNAAELREALERVSRKSISRSLSVETVIDAARNIALPILEADSELVERVARTLWFLDAGGWARMTSWEAAEDGTKNYWREQAQAVVAAISTPTPGAE